ncbi:MAG: prolipoprotein diacylglyceryl transferase [Lachnospiraceae bacterium]|nr:prolipoprotein diacylglyceryl transferase [Lachnospiraceae bacterium]
MEEESKMFPTIHLVLPSYAVFAVIGGIVSFSFLYVRTKIFDIDKLDYIKMFVICVLFGFLGSRIVYFLSRLTWLANHYSLHNIFSIIIDGGFVYYGGLIGVLIGVKIYCGIKKLNYLPIKNMIAPAIPLFHAFGRIGCFMAGCCFGSRLEKPLVVFDTFVLYRVPVQLIEALFEFILFLIIYVSQKKYEKFDWLKIYLITYALFRFVIEFLRGDTIRGIIFGISTSQIISILFLTYYLILFLKRKRCE